MVEAPSLISLCLDTVAEQILRGDGDDDIVADVYELPSELLDCLLPRLTPLALENLQQHMPFCTHEDYGTADCNSGIRRKRKRWLNFETAWKTLYKARWPSLGTRSCSISWLAKQNGEKDELTDDWQQIYWERHLQNCLDAAAEIALLPRFDGSIGEIAIPAPIMSSMGCRGNMRNSIGYSKFSDHCQQFGSYSRCLTLPGAFCVPEICHLLRSNRLESLEVHWIKSKEHVDGLCGLLKQNVETLKSIEFIHCKLSTSFVNCICDSLSIKGVSTHGIHHFSIKTSSFLERDSFPLPVGLASFLASGRYLSSLSLCDDHLHQNFVKMVLETLLDVSSSITLLDLSENNITGWLSHLKWKSTKGKQLSFGIGKSLASLRVLNLRSCNLQKDDTGCLKYALVHMPKLETLDLSNNPIEDDGIKSMIPYFSEMSERHFPLVDLRLGNCELTCDGVNQLLGTLSTWKKPLRALSVGENDLGRKMGAELGIFLCKGIQTLNIEDIGLGSFGFRDAQEEIKGELMLVYINISKNRGGSETANFLSKLISCAPTLVEISAGYNFMPVESLSVICSSLKVTKGKLEHLDLTGNTSCEQYAVSPAAMDEFQINGRCILKFGSSCSWTAPYDDDP